MSNLVSLAIKERAPVPSAAESTEALEHTISVAARHPRMANYAMVRIFISSPSDVRPERLKAEQIIRRLDSEFAHHLRIEPVLWEREPLVATHHFQDPENIPRPRDTDIVVVILWSRLGLPLPADGFRGAVSGRCPVTGTEWEFEDALASARERGVPDLLLYHKTAAPTAALDDRKALDERLAQLDLVANFFTRWFRSGDGLSLSAASHCFSATSEFEQLLYEHLHALLARHVGGAAAGREIFWHEAPFRALLSYEYEHEPVFFGRTRARNELRELLARQIGRGSAFVLVFGASGSGKSSLVKAGLLPDVGLPGMIGRIGLVRQGLMRPSDNAGDPLAALSAAILSPRALPELLGLHYTPERLCTLLRKLRQEASVPLAQGLAAAARSAKLSETAEARLALVVDQLEEIFTIEGLGRDEREAFVAALAALARSGLVWVFATMRSDFFDRLETLPPLAALSAGEARFLLLPPDDSEISQIIRQPVQEAGLRYEPDAARGTNLDEVIRQAAADRGVLPLLSFLLDQLWQKRSAAGFLTFAAYRELGGLEGAIGRRAEEVFAALPESAQHELVPLLRALVTVRGTAATARAAPLSLFPEGSPRRDLVEAFLHPGARLLVSDGDSGRAQIRLAHEALLTHWPRARDQIAADARDLELRGRLEEEAERWQAASRRDRRGRVLTGLPLAEARALLARWGGDLPGLVKVFIAASRCASRRRLFRLAGMVAAAPLGLASIAVIAWAAMVWWGVRQVEAEMKFIVIPGGCFAMGSPEDEANRYPHEGPVHQVCLKAFDLGQFAVTRDEWRRVMVFIDPDPSYFKGGDQVPVENVTWNEAQRFLWLMSFFGQGRYRLPSEAEYEYAERAGTTPMPYYWGQQLEDACAHENVADLRLKKKKPDSSVVNCNDGYGYRTAPVGSFTPNPWKLYDIDGNVQVWVEDCYTKDYHVTPRDGSPNTSGPCTSRVVRGGSWGAPPWRLRSASRLDYSPDLRSYNVGLRVVRTFAPE